MAMCVPPPFTASLNQSYVAVSLCSDWHLCKTRWCLHVAAAKLWQPSGNGPNQRRLRSRQRPPRFYILAPVDISWLRHVSALTWQTAVARAIDRGILQRVPKHEPSRYATLPASRFPHPTREAWRTCAEGQGSRWGETVALAMVLHLTNAPCDCVRIATFMCKSATDFTTILGL